MQRLEDARPPAGARLSLSLSLVPCLHGAVAFPLPPDKAAKRSACFARGCPSHLNCGLLWCVALVHAPVMLAGVCTSNSSSRQRPLCATMAINSGERLRVAEAGNKASITKNLKMIFPALVDFQSWNLISGENRRVLQHRARAFACVGVRACVGAASIWCESNHRSRRRGNLASEPCAPRHGV